MIHAKNQDPCQNRKSSATSLEHQTPNRSILAVACRAPSSVSDAMQGLRPRAATGRFSVVSRAARPASRNRPRRNRPTMRKPCSALSACRGERTGAPHLSPVHVFRRRLSRASCCRGVSRTRQLVAKPPRPLTHAGAADAHGCGVAVTVPPPWSPASLSTGAPRPLRLPAGSPRVHH